MKVRFSFLRFHQSAFQNSIWKAFFFFHFSFFIISFFISPYLHAMLLQYASINSGSNGNCYYVGNSTDAVLIDVGIHCSEVEERMANLKLDIKKVKAIFISHEHTDHIRGAYKLATKYQLPVYLSLGTLTASNYDLKQASTKYISHEMTVEIGSLKVIPFSKIHDAADPFSFTIEFEGTKVAVITDIGNACHHVKKHISECDAAILEANYDKEMLVKGKYPFYLKERIAGGEGHISNTQALDLFLNYRSSKLKHLILGHLSKENNKPEIVARLFSKHAGNCKVDIASRYEESELFEVESNSIRIVESKMVQYDLFND